ncbi:hypothetical protein RD792_017249 [Penstemon davidsonii]|uniref:Protein ABCI12, chloroplastic n=1 Tax=Penstemon davidsonii TaxID=160366 RepID=A0ABR0CLQ2_9LAMI|nr:hypothetical protein RD792_017249 [Penstemon davidsonii]
MYPKLLSSNPKLLVIFPSPPSPHTFRTPPEILSLRLQLHSLRKLKSQISCAANNNNEADGSTKNWEKWMPRNLFAAEKVFGTISGATSSPIAQYISSPTTFLHTVDPRIKMDQLGRVFLLCGVLFVLLGLSTDSAPSLLSSRSPPSSVTGLSTLPASFEVYRYVIMKLGPLQLTRKGLSAASTAASLTFTIFQSASLCLTTTTSEQLAFALRWCILPLSSLGVPVAEVILTLLLSLRFINLVFDEVRNVALGIVSRRINWQQLTTLETIDVFFTYIHRIFKNINNHAEQISQAMIVRGFRGDCNSYKVLLSAGSSTTIANVVSFSCLVGLISAVTLSRYFYF